MAQTVILRGGAQRRLARELIDKAPAGAVLTISEAKRTLDQNAKLHAMISDVSRHKPEGRMHTVDIWKQLFMSACGHQVQFVNGLEDGQPFPCGLKTSKLNKAQMADLITCVYEYGDRHGVNWTDPKHKEE